MKWSFCFFVGLRYTQAKQRNRFVSFIALMSIIGIALGVMVLITVLSVMNGFDRQIRQKLFTMVPHITINQLSPHQGIHNWQALKKRIANNQHVQTVAPIVKGQALLSEDGTTTPALINGVQPEHNHIYDLKNKLTMGHLKHLKPGQFGIILGSGIAQKLGVAVGDSINVITPKVAYTPAGVIPRFKQFVVQGIFDAGGGFGFNNHFAFINLKDAQTLFQLSHQVTDLQIKIYNLFNAPKQAQYWRQHLGLHYSISDWTQRFGAFYHAVQMEKTIMFFILLLIIAIASFNLVSGLVMGVKDKQADIAILKTLGATPRMIQGIFIIQGSVISLIGIVVGVILGVTLSLNVTQLVSWIQQLFHVQLINPNVYLVNYLPSHLEWTDVAKVSAIAFIMGLLATLYPARQAGKTQPAEALRYE